MSLPVKSLTCLQRVFDHENAETNKAIWNQYGSELAGDFGTKFCGKPVVWGERCEEHKIERRWNIERRQEDKLLRIELQTKSMLGILAEQKIRQYVLERTGIPLDESCDPVEWLIASHYGLGEMVIEKAKETKK